MKKLLFFILGLGLFLFACAKPPTDVMDRAIEALNRAENDINAVLYAPSLLVRAREAFAMMQEEAGSKRFDAARLHAAEVISYSERAMREGNAISTRASNDALTLLNGLQAPLADTETNLNNAKNLPSIELDYNRLDGLLDNAKGTYENAQQSYTNGNYPETMDQGQAVRTILGDINTQISGAAFASARKK